MYFEDSDDERHMWKLGRLLHLLEHLAPVVVSQRGRLPHDQFAGSGGTPPSFDLSG